MKVFVDWSITKNYELVCEDDNGELTHNNSAELNLLPNSDVYLESGSPKFLLYQLISSGHKIFICQGKEVKALREELKVKKDDKTDATLVNILYHQKPEKFVEMTEKGQDDVRLEFIMGKFAQLEKVTTRLKNQQKAAEREYGKIDIYDKTILMYEEEKNKIIDSAMPLMSPEYRRVKHIKGVGPRLTAKFLAQCHPRDFSTLSKWLMYCGYKGCVLPRWKKGKGRRPNYQAKSILYLMAVGTMTSRDRTYRPIYDQCKERYEKERPEFKNEDGTFKKGKRGHLHGMALNRVATQIAKEFWHKLHDISKWSLIKELLMRKEAK